MIIFTLLSKFPAISSNTGHNILQGPHQGARKSIILIFSLLVAFSNSALQFTFMILLSPFVVTVSSLFPLS